MYKKRTFRNRHCYL